MAPKHSAWAAAGRRFLSFALRWRNGYDAGRTVCRQRRAISAFPDFPFAQVACYPLHGYGHERCGADHAAAVHEQVCLPHHRRYAGIGALRHSAGAVVSAGIDHYGQGVVLLYLRGTGHVDLRMVHPAHSVQGYRDGAAGGHYVRQHHRWCDQLSGVPLRNDPSAVLVGSRSFLHGAARTVRDCVPGCSVAGNLVYLCQPFQYCRHG